MGTLLLLWPTLIALIIAAEGRPSASTLFIFVCGVFLMRSAGCILNDLADIKFDRHVARTRNRPLTSGKISKWEALLLCFVLLLAALALVLLLNVYTLALAVLGLVFAGIYPLLKRVTHFPQLGLGIAFNWGIPMAFAAQTQQVPLVAWLLFLIGILWTLSYDTLYAMADREDDLKIGIKSTAILFADYDRVIIAALQLAVLLLLALLGFILKLNLWYYAALIICASLFLYQQGLIRLRQTEECLQAFLNNQWAYFIIFFGVYLSYSP